MIHLSSILNRSSPPDRLRTPCCLQLDYPERCTSLVSHLFYSRKWGEQNQQSQSRVLHKKRWAAGNLRVAHWSKSHRANTLGCWKWNGEKYFSQGLINCEVRLAMQILFCFQALFVLWTWRQFHLWSSLKDWKCKVFSYILTCKCISQAGDLTAVFLFGSFAHPDEENFSAFAFQ